MSPHLRLVRRVSLFVLLSLLISLVPPTRPQPRPVAAAPAHPAPAAPRAGAAPALTSACAAAPFGVATDFNVFILGDLTHQFTDTEGRLAVGGNATLESYGVGRQLTADADATDTLVVGGDLHYTHGEVAHGHVAHGGTATLTNVTLLTGTARQDTPLDFAAAAVDVATRAREWAALPATGTTQVTDWGAITLEGSDPTRNVFTLAGADLARATDLTIRVPAGATALINIDGTSNRMQYFGITLDGPTPAQVVYTMPQATELTLDDIGVRGSILAPHAAISFPNGNIDGTLIGASLTGRGEAHHVPPAVCLPELPPTPTPTPTATETPTATATGTATATATATATSTATATPTSTPTPTVPPLDNLPPRVDAGPDQVLSLEQTSTYLDGQAVDDGLPFGTLTVTWTLVHGPTDLFLADTGSVNSLVRITVPGTYTLRLTASDGALHASDEMQLRITDAAQMPDLAAISVNAGALTVQGQTLQAAGTVSAVVANPGPTAITGTVTLAFFEEQAVGARRLATSTLDGLAPGATTTVTATVTGDLLFPGNRISVLVDPDDHLAETDETNNIAHTRSTCEDLPPTSIFSPTLEWEWPADRPRADLVEPTSDAVIMTPAVADLTGDGIPEIIFTSFPGSPNTVGHLRAIRGDDGSPVFTVTHPDHRLYDTSQLAVGDIDADGQMEIVGGAASRNHLIAFEHTGAFKWMSPVIATGASVHRGGPALADLDGDGHSEVILGATVLDGRTGQILATHLDSTMGRGDNAQGPLSLVADVNGDGVPEIVAGNTLYRYVPDTPVLVQDTPPIRALEVVWHNTDVQDGFPAVATFDDDRTAEIVLVTQGEVVILDGGDGRIRWGPIAIPQGGAGGAPTIGDMDGDGAPEIGVAGSSQYTVFEIADGVLDKKWDIGIYDRSATTGSSVFDFDGDGQAEVVYGDEDYLYVYRGGDAPPALAGDDAAVAAWRTRAKLANPSATAAEMTLVADVDADGHAEIVKVSNGGGMYGIQIYGDQNHAWSATRPLWNQHTYHITNINDDGTIPAREANNWETFNNYRLNTFLSGCATARPDLTASYVRLARETTSLTLTARIGNGGGLFVPAGVPVSWYAGAPANRDLLGTVTTTQRLEPGQYTDIALTLPVGTTTESPVWVVADDQGDGTGRHTEVSETNNAHNAHLYLSATPNTPPVVDAGPDQGTAFYTPTVTLAGNASDDGLPGDRLQVFWTPVSGPGPVTLADRTDPQTTATFAQAGTYELDLVATDGELTSRDRVTITVEPDPALPIPAPPVPPVPAALSIPGWIGSPATATTISAPLPITLAAGITLQDGTLDYWPADDPTAVTEVATGLSGRGGDTLTTFDPTLLANGSYVVRLTGTADDGRTLASGILVTVAGTYKPGRVRFSVTDLTVPVTGLPITIGRTYDSLERYAVGDFGYGWNLTLGSPDLEVTPQQDVTLTMPNGERVTFYFTPRSYGGLFGALLQPGYTPEAGVYGTLTANGCPIVVAGGGGSSSGYLCFLDRPQYAPTVYTYEDPYGQVFTMAADGTLRTIKDLNGNTLTFSPDGIRSSSGRSVIFDRDAQGRITQITDPAGNVYGYGYDGNGDLVEIDLPGVEPHVQYAYADPAHPHLFTRATDPRGHPAAQTTFSPDGRLERVTDAMGHTTSYAYDVPGRVTTVTNPDGGTLTLVYDAYGMVQSETDPLGRTTTYTYTANRDLAAQTNALGETTSYTYDANGNRTSTTNPRGATWTTSYHRYGGPTHMRDPLGREQTMTYDARFIPTSMQDSLGLIGSATFDDYGNLLGFTDGNGHTVSYVYDQYGNQTQTTNQLNHTTVMTYDPLGRQVTETDARNFTTRYAYDALGRLRTVTQPEVQTPDGPVTPLIQYDYDANGNRTAMIDPLNRRTVYGYDAANRLIETRFPDTSTITHTYDWRGNVIFTQDQAGHITAYAYDLAGQLVAETHADGTPDAGTITYAYDLAGRRTTVTDPLGHTTSYAYDAADNLVSVTNARNATTRYAYDAANQQVSMTDARGNTTAYAYNPRGLLTVTTYHDGTTSAQTYDIVGRTISATDQEHHVTTYAYDAAGQVIAVTNAENEVTRYTYDAVGNRLTVTDANNHTTTSTYDARNRQTSRELPLGMIETFTYDAVGNPVAHTDFNGHTTISSYDELDRLRTIVPDPVLGEPTIGYTYTLTGQRAAMSDGTGTTTYAYDALNRLTTKATPFGMLSYTYDAASNLLTMQSSNTNGVAVSYAYDDLNRLETVTDQRLNPGTTSYTYDAVGNLDTLTYPNGVASAHTYDDLNRLTELEISAGTLLGRYTYTLDDTGARTKLVDETGRTVDYGYDATYRLLNETITNDPQGSNGRISYTYDATGNRLHRRSDLDGVSDQTVSYDANDRPTTDTYDNNGNLLTAAGTTYSYDYANRLVSAGSITLTYDGDGTLVAQTVGGVTTTYLVDTQNPTGYAQIVEEQVNGQVQRTLTYGYDLISVNAVHGGSATPHFTGYDGLGTVRFLTDSAGTVTDEYEYEAFGGMLHSSGSTANPYRFTGERYDADLELYYLRARWYNQGTGRFLTQDTYPINIHNPIELNRYVYTANNPVNAVDPSGLSSINTYGLRLQTFAVPASKAILPRIVDPLVKFLIIMSLGFFLASDSSSSEEINDNTKVKDILGHLKGSTQKAPFPKGFPGIQSEEIGEMTLRDVKKAAKQNRPGFKTLKKLLTDKRFRR